MAEFSIWQLAEDHVVPRRNKPVLARSELPVSAILAAGLTVVPQEPPPKHANIANWPPEKDEWKALALEMAASATLLLQAP